MDYSYLLMPSIMGSVKTQYALLDVILIIVIMASMGLMSDLIKKGFEKISFYVTNYFDSKKKSIIAIAITSKATDDSSYGNYIVDIPKQYIAILFHMYTNNIDPKYIRQINNQKHFSLSGLNNEIKMTAIKRNEENKYKYFLTYPYEIKISNDIRLKSSRIKDEQLKEKTDGWESRDGIVTYNIELYSYTLNSYQLKNVLSEWVNDYDIYLQKMNNNNLFYLIYDKYEQREKITINDTRFFDKNNSRNVPSLVKNVPTFEIHNFVTNKSFHNIFFEGKELLKRKLDMFIKCKDNYERLGQQYSLGLLFHGKPGCGKTSTIKAIAKYTNRNVVSISLKQVKTFKELRDIFFTDEYESINLSFDNKIIVFEDIDCMTNIIKDRNYKKNKKIKNSESNSENLDNSEPVIDVKTIAMMGAINAGFNKMNKTISNNVDSIEEESNITLSDFLNLMDGVLEQPGRIVIMTSNYPEKIDKALLRFGRIDLKIEFKLCNREIATQIIEFYYNKKISQPLEITSYKFSPTDILEQCFKCDSIDELVEKLYENNKISNVDSNDNIDNIDNIDSTDNIDHIDNTQNKLIDLDKFHEHE